VTCRVLKEGGLIKIEPNGKSIALAMVNGNVYAMDSVCSHEGGSLEEGTLGVYNPTCPWHYGVFDIRNASVSRPVLPPTSNKISPGVISICFVINWILFFAPKAKNDSCNLITNLLYGFLIYVIISICSAMQCLIFVTP